MGTVPVKVLDVNSHLSVLQPTASRYTNSATAVPAGELRGTLTPSALNMYNNVINISLNHSMGVLIHIPSYVRINYIFSYKIKIARK